MKIKINILKNRILINKINFKLKIIIKKYNLII